MQNEKEKKKKKKKRRDIRKGLMGGGSSEYAKMTREFCLTRYFFNLHYAVNLQLRLRAKTKANPERGRAKSELGWAKSEQGRAKSEQGRASWKFHIEY